MTGCAQHSGGSAGREIPLASRTTWYALPSVFYVNAFSCSRPDSVV